MENEEIRCTCGFVLLLTPQPDQGTRDQSIKFIFKDTVSGCNPPHRVSVLYILSQNPLLS